MFNPECCRHPDATPINRPSRSRALSAANPFGRAREPRLPMASHQGRRRRKARASASSQRPVVCLSHDREQVTNACRSSVFLREVSQRGRRESAWWRAARSGAALACARGHRARRCVCLRRSLPRRAARCPHARADLPDSGAVCASTPPGRDRFPREGGWNGLHERPGNFRSPCAYPLPSHGRNAAVTGHRPPWPDELVLPGAKGKRHGDRTSSRVRDARGGSRRGSWACHRVCSVRAALGGGGVGRSVGGAGARPSLVRRRTRAGALCRR